MSRGPIKTAAAILAAGILLGGGAAAAQENPNRGGTVTIQNDAGKTTTIDRDVSGAAGNRSGSSTITGPNGKTYNRSFDRSCDPGTSACSRSSTATGPNGQSRSVEGTTIRTDSGQFENTRGVTNSKGGSRERRRWIQVNPSN